MKRQRPKAEPILQPTLFELEKPSAPATQPNIERLFSLPSILLGTSSFTAKGWEGTFYPATMRSRDFLSHYARQFQTVEIDSSFYYGIQRFFGPATMGKIPSHDRNPAPMPYSI